MLGALSLTLGASSSSESKAGKVWALPVRLRVAGIAAGTAAGTAACVLTAGACMLSSLLTMLLWQ